MGSTAHRWDCDEDPGVIQQVAVAVEVNQSGAQHILEMRLRCPLLVKQTQN